MADNLTNLTIWNQVREVPASAKKKINGGRLNGMSDINPMWRYQVLTAIFGPVGFGWYYVVTNQWLEPGANGEVTAFVNINLYVKVGGEWSQPIPGNGGSMYIANESKGARTSDEAYKMATTDALSVACKVLGIGADVYWENGSKYGKNVKSEPETTTAPKATEAPKAEQTAPVTTEPVAPATTAQATPDAPTETTAEPEKAEETQKADVPVDELPVPKTKAENDLKSYLAIKIADGRTLGEVLEANREELKTIATSEPKVKKYCVALYNARIKGQI